MIAEEKNSSISKNNSGFPEYLDFEKLRRESIEYISQLSGKIWTDHNVHDPGITILEVLCYALLDLGYRTHLPIEDILAKNPNDTGGDTNFFTAAQILSCNPLTITDYRKLLIDLDGVRNAWLFPAGEKDSCRRIPSSGLQSGPEEIILNGIYHVQIELEKYPDPDSTLSINEFAKKTLENVKSALMEHRNFCEDFLDISILCRFEIGVCATIELDDQADPEVVYVELIQALNAFFSPAPHFYTLQQLLEKNLGIDEIYAGRPYDRTDSHGFVDTTELEALQLRKEIHISDVYTALFQVKGIKKISSLRLIDCRKSNTSLGNWKVSIPKDHVPAFTVPCSGFEFIRNGLKVSVDTQKFETLFEFGFNTENKTSYPYLSPYLNPVLPQGNYMETLSDYYSIQNEFPQVYGIGNGHLPDTVPVLRKAQALQLKGYLLFFDQLLANYLSQLQHVRDYFSLSAPKDKNSRHTYFLNQLQTVPDIDKLLRFSSGNADVLGQKGATLALPVSIAAWEKLKTFTGNIQDCINTLTPYEFSSLSEVTDAIQILQNDLIITTDTSIQTFRTSNDVWCYAIATTDPNYVLLSKQTFDTEQATIQHASSLQYAAIHEDNYRHFITPHNKFSFEVEFNITSYTGYLELLMEDETLYRHRRKDFLNHLLARFSERFTEFALLKWQDEQSIGTVENFLTNYDTLSRDRGRAYNYQLPEWNSSNQSGFEKKVKALAGFSQQDSTLCNFIVEPCEEHFTITITHGNDILFTSKEKFDSRAEAESAAAGIVKAMSSSAAYHTHYIGHEKSYQLQLHYGQAIPATYPRLFKNSQHAEQLAYYLLSCANPHPEKANIRISKYIWRGELCNYQNEVLAVSVNTYDTAEKAHADSVKQLKKLSDTTIWQVPTGIALPAIQMEKVDESEVVFIDIHAFKLDINDTIIGKPGKYTYDLLDQSNTFKLSPKETFDSSKAARDHAHNMLALAADFNNWQIERHSKSGLFSINLCKKGVVEASFVTQTEEYAETEEQLMRIYELIKEHIYHFAETEHPDRWKFKYTLGYEEENSYVFESDEEYPSEKEATAALSLFYGGLEALTLKTGAGRAVTLTVPDKHTSSVSLITDGKEASDSREKINRLLQYQKGILQVFKNSSQTRLSQYVQSDQPNEQSSFIYRLVNNNHIPARSPLPILSSGDLQLYKRKLASAYKQQQWFPTICLGGDIVRQHTDLEGNTRFHFEIRFRNLPLPFCEEIVMFTSSMGYLTEQEAEKAFQENYLHILRLAADTAEYGKHIGLTPVYLPQSPAIPLSDVIAFIPEETIQLFKNNFKENWLTSFIQFSVFYPVKVIRKISKRFAELFCLDSQTNDTSCGSSSTEEWVYYFDFSLLNPIPGLDDTSWISTRYFQTPEEALQEFIYFNRLLAFTGNWYMDTFYCSSTKTSGYYFFIREVLAESSVCFASEREAWGENGVEAFICAIQSSGGIQNYLRKTDCSYSFYVGCGESLINHPCTYDTSARRDEAMNELYSRFKKLTDVRAFAIQYENGDWVLNNREGIPFAKLRDNQNGSPCDTGIIIAETAQATDSSWEAGQGVYFLRSADKKISIESYEKNETLSLSDWKAMLEEWACFFPITRTVTGTKVITDEGGTHTLTTYSYCIEIKLPGFGNCAKDKLPDTPCNCEKQATITSGYCHIAWKSTCCLDSCEEASRVLESARELLSDFRDYYATFDCHAHFFGIALREEAKMIEDISRKGKIIANNPQVYSTPDQACNATEDALSLTNAAGLHVVEHLLLRPHCQEDCACEERLQHCDLYSGCHFPPYLTSNSDPCVKDEPLIFTPGADPYSFIATVMLPAWPVLLREADKKEQAEHILYSEAPAHVLLRILWLRPFDFYRFETQFKKWKQQVAGIPFSRNDFSVCDFLHLVTKESYTCLPDCTICKPCSGAATKSGTPCNSLEGSEMNQKRKENGFLNQVNEIFCMGSYRCDDGTPAREQLSVKEKPVSKKPVEPKPVSKKGTAAKKTDPSTKKMEKGSAQIYTEVDPKAKAQFINSRHKKYLQVIHTVLDHTHENPLAVKAAAFIQNNHPGIGRLELLIKEIFQNKKPDNKKIKALTKKQVADLIQAAMHHYLDKVAFNGKETSQITALSPIINELKKAKIDLLHLYTSWDLVHVSEYEPGLDMQLVKKVITQK